MKNKPLTNNNIFVVLFALFVNVINYCFQILSGRILSVNDYGLINTLFSLFAILGSPHFAIKMIVAKETTILSNENNHKRLSLFLSQMLIYISLLSIIVVFLISGIHALIPSVFGIDSYYLIVLVCVLSASTFYMFVPEGIAQGLQFFYTMSFVSLILAFIKILGLFIGAYALDSFVSPVITIMYITIFGTLFSAGLGYYVLKKKKPSLRLAGLKEISGHKNVVSIKESTHSFIVNCVLIFLMSIDIVLVNRTSNEYVTGLYTASTIWGKVLVYALMAVGNIFYPKILKRHINNQNTHKQYLQTLVLCISATLALYLFILLFGKPLTTFIFGQRYLESLSYLKYSYTIAAMIALNNLNMNYCLAVGQSNILTYIFVLAGIISIICGFIVFSDLSLTLISFVVILSVAFLTMFIYILLLRDKRQSNAKEI